MPMFLLPRTVAGQLIAYVAAMVLAAFWIVSGTPKSWGASIPDAVHTYGIRFRGSDDLFFRPSIGWFLEHGLLVVIGIALLAVTTDLITRRR
jgi:hypothetical protein